jgi:hypothetical protein
MKLSQVFFSPRDGEVSYSSLLQRNRADLHVLKDHMVLHQGCTEELSGLEVWLKQYSTGLFKALSSNPRITPPTKTIIWYVSFS